MEDQNSYTRENQAVIMTKVENAFIALRDGSNRTSDFNTLIGAMNIGMVCAESIGDGAVEVFRKAQRALLEAESPYPTLAKFTFDPVGLIDLARAIEAYSQILSETSPTQMQGALREVERRLAAGRHVTLQDRVLH